jgi:LPS export ABC transporter protein LptC
MAIAHSHRLAVVAAIAALVASACNDATNPTLSARPSALPDSADQVMFGLRHALTSDGVRRGELRADTAYFYDQNNRIELRGVNTVFFTNEGVRNATMTAHEGTYDVRLQKLDGRGNVVLTSDDGRKLTSPHLVYERTVNQVWSDTNFTFTSPGRTLSGIGFRSDPQLRNVQVLRGARGRTVVPAGGLSRGVTP